MNEITMKAAEPLLYADAIGRSALKNLKPEEVF